MPRRAPKECTSPGCHVLVESGRCAAHPYPLRPCAVPGCEVLVEWGSCAKHRPRSYQASSTARGYGSAWQRLRLAFLARSPRCQCGALAVEVHHRRPLSQGGTNTPGNLEAMCRPCHRRHTARNDGAFGNPRRAPAGVGG